MIIQPVNRLPVFARLHGVPGHPLRRSLSQPRGRQRIDVPCPPGKVSLIPGPHGFVLPVLLGNTVGGVVVVTIVNYFQTTKMRLKEAREFGPDEQLSWGELFFGGIVGRSYVGSSTKNKAD